MRRWVVPPGRRWFVHRLRPNLWPRFRHIHKASKGGGQTLICVGGHGYYQEWGKNPVELLPGDAVHIPAGVKHWHGAAPDSWFSHLAIEVPGEDSSNEWLEPVDEKEYAKLK